MSTVVLEDEGSGAKEVTVRGDSLPFELMCQPAELTSGDQVEGDLLVEAWAGAGSSLATRDRELNTVL